MDLVGSRTTRKENNMKVKMYLRYWEGDVFLFDVVVKAKKGKKNPKAVAEGRAIVNIKMVNHEYAGHCCIDGDEEYMNDDVEREIVTACLKRAKTLQEKVIKVGDNEQTSQEDMIS